MSRTAYIWPNIQRYVHIKNVIELFLEEYESVPPVTAADIVKLKNAKCKSFVTMDLRWWPNLKALAERCNISEYCLYTANTDLLKKYSLPDGTFLPGMKGRKLNIGCFHRSNY